MSLATWAAALSVAALQAAPADLSMFIEKAHLQGDVVAWCRGDWRPGQPGGYSVALGSAKGGRYLVFSPDGAVVELAPFAGPPDLSCYTPEEARQLNATIAKSETIRGHIAPRFGTTVACGFVDATSAVCWQYSPRDRRYVKVGEWQT